MENRDLRILHVHNAGGQGVKFARALRELGYNADCLAFESDFQMADADIQVRTTRPKWLSRQLKGLRLLGMLRTRYDIFHLHTGSFLKFGLDVPVIQAMSKKVVVHFHGGELIRTHDSPLSRKLFGEETVLVRADVSSRTWLEERCADHTLVSTPNLLRYVPRAQWIPQPIDLSQWVPTSREPRGGVDDEIRIVHSPSIKRTKGTQFLVEAVDDLRARGLKVHLDIVHGVSHREVKGRLCMGDIFVDQLLIGLYGNAAIEAMAMGLPTVCYLEPHLVHHFPDCPIVNASPRDIRDKLEDLVVNSWKRLALGRQGRQYVERVHDIHKLTAGLLDLYARILKPNAQPSPH